MSRARILVVEDDPMSRRLLRDILRYRGYEVVEAAGVDDAREQLSPALDLVLLDLQIPGGGGEKLLAEIRAMPAISGLPVVAITASAMPGVREQLLGLGFDDYRSKPIDTRAIGPLVESFLHCKEGTDGSG